MIASGVKRKVTLVYKGILGIKTGWINSVLGLESLYMLIIKRSMERSHNRIYRNNAGVTGLVL